MPSRGVYCYAVLMSKRKAAALSVAGALVLATLFVGGMVLLPGITDNDDDAANASRRVEKNGVVVTLEDVEFSPEETVVTLLIHNPQIADHGVVPILPVITGIYARGLVSTAEPVFLNAQEVDRKTLRQGVRLGPISASHKEVSVTILEIVFPGMGVDVGPVQGALDIPALYPVLMRLTVSQIEPGFVDSPC